MPSLRPKDGGDRPSTTPTRRGVDRLARSGGAGGGATIRGGGSSGGRTGTASAGSGRAMIGTLSGRGGGRPTSAMAPTAISASTARATPPTHERDRNGGAGGTTAIGAGRMERAVGNWRDREK